MNIMTLPEIMDRSLDILRKYIKSVIIFSLLYMIIAFIILIPVIIIAVVIIAITTTTGASSDIPVIVLILLAVPLYLGITLSYHIGVIKIASQDVLNEKVLAYDAIKASFKSFFKVLGIGVAGFVLSLPLLTVLGGGGYLIFRRWDLSGFLDDPFTGILGSDANAVLLIIMLIFAILILVLIISAYMSFFSFSLQALILEKRSVAGSIKRSFSMVKSAFWRIFGCSVLFYATISLVTFSLQSFAALVGGLVYLLLQFLNIPQDALAFVALAYNYGSYPVSIISWLVLTPLQVIMMTLLYYNRRFISEGYDITLKLDEIRRNGLGTELKSEIESELNQ